TSLFASLGIVSVQAHYTRQRGDVLVAAIERYRGDHGRYPDALADLLPRYVQTIPRTCMCWIGGRFWYGHWPSPINGKERFRLWYGAPMGVTQQGEEYWSDLGRWGATKL